MVGCKGCSAARAAELTRLASRLIEHGASAVFANSFLYIMGMERNFVNELRPLAEENRSGLIGLFCCDGEV